MLGINPVVFSSGAYLDVRTSLEWFYSICTHNSIDPKQFVKTCEMVMNRWKPKRNAILLYGEKNCGKTLLMQSICSSVIFYANITTMTGASSFEFADAVGARCILLNEPNINDRTVEMVKNVLEGCPATVDVKYQSGCVLDKTPVFITTNKNPICQTACNSIHEPALNARMIRFNMKSFPLLKDCDAMLNPLMWITLLKEHGTTVA